ncbi:unnamed protein product, partial [Candidula unifasciata]
GGKSKHYDIPYHQWKSYVAAMTKKEEEKASHIQDILAELEEGSDTHNVMIKRLNERVVNIERNQIMAGFILESIMNSVEALDPSMPAPISQIRRVHTASRSSPYPGTYINRFPVLEKDVSWDVKFEAYDPSTYTKPVEEFPRDVQKWIDRDILKLRVQQEEQGLTELDDETGPVTGPLPDPIFNTVQMVQLSNEIEIAINRISYITVGDSALQYEIDSTGAPRNPMGRTGLRGRGNLWRWGPNHMIQAVISRWGNQLVDSSVQGSKTGSKNMEILVEKDSTDSSLITLPGCRVQSGMTPYSSICNYATKDILLETSGIAEQDYDQDDMVEFFSKFSTSDMRKKKKSMYTTLGYSAFLVYHGYADDASNTDNAWKETEIWNFHYKYKDAFDTYVKD